MTKGQSNESVKEVLLCFKNRPEGFVANSVLSSALTEAAEKGNVENMDYIIPEFADRLDLDEGEASRVVLGYIKSRDEKKAIKSLDLLKGEDVDYKLWDLQDDARDAKMNDLVRIIQSRLDGLIPN